MIHIGITMRKEDRTKDSFGANYMMLNSFESVNHTIYRAFLILYYESKTKQYVIQKKIETVFRANKKYKFSPRKE